MSASSDVFIRLRYTRLQSSAAQQLAVGSQLNVRLVERLFGAVQIGVRRNQTQPRVEQPLSELGNGFGVHTAATAISVPSVSPVLPCLDGMRDSQAIEGGVHRCGSSSPTWLARCIGSRSRTSLR